MKLQGPCLACARGFHEECDLGKCKKCHSKETDENISTDDAGMRLPTTRKSKITGLKDEKSTGRKRAAILYPIDSSLPCEWRGKKNCGGGRRPIIGCLSGNQQDRHHGPVKRPTRNEEGNVHRICKACHVHWHELNDLIYVEADYNNLPHDPVAATDVEIMAELVKWKSGEMGRLFELASSQNLDKFKKRMKEHEDEDSM